ADAEELREADGARPRPRGCHRPSGGARVWRAGRGAKSFLIHVPIRLGGEARLVPKASLDWQFLVPHPNRMKTAEVAARLAEFFRLDAYPADDFADIGQFCREAVVPVGRYARPQ